MHYLLYVKYIYHRDLINMNNFKSIINKGRIQISIYILVQNYESAYYLIYIYNKRVFKCEIMSSPYLFTLLKHEVLRLTESEDE